MGENQRLVAVEVVYDVLIAGRSEVRNGDYAVVVVAPYEYLYAGADFADTLNAAVSDVVPDFTVLFERDLV